MCLEQRQGSRSQRLCSAPRFSKKLPGAFRPLLRLPEPVELLPVKPGRVSTAPAVRAPVLQDRAGTGSREVERV